MKRYILIYYRDDYADNGGGTYYESFLYHGSKPEDQLENFEEFSYEPEQDMHKRVNELLDMYEETFSVLFAGASIEEFNYEPVEVIKKLNPRRKA